MLDNENFLVAGINLRPFLINEKQKNLLVVGSSRRDAFGIPTTQLPFIINEKQNILTAPPALDLITYRFLFADNHNHVTQEPTPEWPDFCYPTHPVE